MVSLPPQLVSVEIAAFLKYDALMQRAEPERSVLVGILVHFNDARELRVPSSVLKPSEEVFP